MSVLYNCLSLYKFVYTHLNHSRQLYNIHISLISSHLISSALKWTGCTDQFSSVQFCSDEMRSDEISLCGLNASLRLTSEIYRHAAMLQQECQLSTVQRTCFVVTSPPRRTVEYCYEYVCLSVCLSVRLHNSKTARKNFAKFVCMLPVAMAWSIS